MKQYVLAPLIDWCQSVGQAWDQFWFTPRLAHTLAVVRIGCGALLVYVHLIWLIFVRDFMGNSAWIDNATIRQLHDANSSMVWAWSYLWYVESPAILAAHEVAAILASAAMMVGFATRFATPIAWLLTLMTCHRLTGALFGLDQVVVMLAMYLMIARAKCAERRCAAEAKRKDWKWLPIGGPDQASVLNNIATRLIQLHLCIIYIFGGLSKMRGEMWFDGSAMWYALVNYEYQSLDMTWLGRYPIVIASLTAITIFWETFYCATVWPRLTRPITLALAFFVHGGIAIALGMVTFGTGMILANLAFIESETTRRWLRLGADERK